MAPFEHSAITPDTWTLGQPHPHRPHVRPARAPGVAVDKRLRQDPRQANWDLDYRPEFEVYLAEHGLAHHSTHTRRSTPGRPHPHRPHVRPTRSHGVAADKRLRHTRDRPTGTWTTARSLRHTWPSTTPCEHSAIASDARTLTTSIRSGNTSVPPEHMEWLLFGLSWTRDGPTGTWTTARLRRTWPSTGPFETFRNHTRRSDNWFPVSATAPSVPPEHMVWLLGERLRHEPPAGRLGTGLPPGV